MANTDPVSGLMSSMGRIRNQAYPGGTAAAAGTAAQAGTLPQVQATRPAQTPRGFQEVLPVPQPQTPPQTPSTAPVSPEQSQGDVVTPEWLAKVGSAFMEVEDGLGPADAYLLSLGYLQGVRSPRMAPGQEGAPSSLPNTLG
jgi:hypothetical protein